MPWLERASEAMAHLVETSAVLAPLGAFLGGALTAVNPCVLAMVPLMVGLAAGVAGKAAARDGTGPEGRRTWLRTLAFSCLFVAGFAAELAVLFTLSAAAARWLQTSWWEYVLAAICVVVALHLLGALRMPAWGAPAFASRAAGVAGALVLGFLFGIVSLPCTGPALLLLIGLVPQVGPARAGFLLFCYGLGHSLLLLVVGTSVGAATALVRAERLQRAARRLRQVAGVLLLGGAAWMILA